MNHFNKKSKKLVLFILFEILCLIGCGQAPIKQPTTIKNLQVTPNVISVMVGLTVQFSATGTYLNDNTADVTQFIDWNSSDTSIAEVDKNGLVTTLSVGNAIITASYTNKLGALLIAKASLDVSPPHTLLSLTISPNSSSNLSSDGGSQQFTCTGVYADGYSENLSYSVNWSSSSPSVATISATGLLTAVAGGTTSIKATLGSVSSTSVGQTVTQSWLYFTNTANSLLYVCKVAGNTLSSCTSTGATNINGPYVSINSTKNYAYISNWGTSQITTCQINSNGTFTSCTPSTLGVINGAAPANLYSALISPNGQFFYATDYNNNRMLYCPVGNFTTASCSTFGSGGAPANFNAMNQPAISPNGLFFYVPNYGSNSVTACSSLAANGRYNSCSTAAGVSGLPSNPGGSAVSQTGSDLYLTLGSSVVFCPINSVTGALSSCNSATTAGILLNGNTGTIAFNAAGTYAFMGDWGASPGMLICHVATNKTFDTCVRVNGTNLGIPNGSSLAWPYYSP